MGVAEHLKSLSLQEDWENLDEPEDVVPKIPEITVQLPGAFRTSTHFKLSDAASATTIAELQLDALTTGKSGVASLDLGLADLDSAQDTFPLLHDSLQKIPNILPQGFKSTVSESTTDKGPPVHSLTVLRHMLQSGNLNPSEPDSFLPLFNHWFMKHEHSPSHQQLSHTMLRQMVLGMMFHSRFGPEAWFERTGQMHVDAMLEHFSLLRLTQACPTPAWCNFPEAANVLVLPMINTHPALRKTAHQCLRNNPNLDQLKILTAYPSLHLFPIAYHLSMPDLSKVCTLPEFVKTFCKTATLQEVRIMMEAFETHHRHQTDTIRHERGHPSDPQNNDDWSVITSLPWADELSENQPLETSAAFDLSDMDPNAAPASHQDPMDTRSHSGPNSKEPSIETLPSEQESRTDDPMKTGSNQAMLFPHEGAVQNPITVASSESSESSSETQEPTASDDHPTTVTPRPSTSATAPQSNHRVQQCNATQRFTNYCATKVATFAHTKL